jgi:hypothetical protein
MSKLPARRRRIKRKPGRPPRDYRDDPDLRVAELAIALQTAWGLSQRAALDLALALRQGARIIPSRLPRGGRKLGHVLVGYMLPMKRSFHSRTADIRRKLKARKLRPNAETVRAIARALHRVRRLGSPDDAESTISDEG